jgi:hypothetical protein
MNILSSLQDTRKGLKEFEKEQHQLFEASKFKPVSPKV